MSRDDLDIRDTPQRVYMVFDLEPVYLRVFIPDRFTDVEPEEDLAKHLATSKIFEEMVTECPKFDLKKTSTE